MRSEEPPGAERAKPLQAIASVVVDRFRVSGSIAIRSKVQPAAESRGAELDREPAAHQTGSGVRPITKGAEPLCHPEGLDVLSARIQLADGCQVRRWYFHADL